MNRYDIATGKKPKPVKKPKDYRADHKEYNYTLLVNANDLNGPRLQGT